MAVSHNEFKTWDSEKWLSLINKNGFIYDLKNIVPLDIVGIRL